MHVAKMRMPVEIRASQLQDAGLLKDEHASLCKAHSTVRMREAVGWAREVLGGNGILLEHHVGRFVADAEAIYSYEGTREVNTLIVGRAITARAPSSDPQPCPGAACCGRQRSTIQPTARLRPR